MLDEGKSIQYDVQICKHCQVIEY
jgi:hypothetical protein